MSKTAYILRTPTRRFVIVWTDEKGNQTLAPLAKDLAPLTDAFSGGTDDTTIRRVARQRGVETYRSLRDVAEVHGMTETQVTTARSRGISVERGA